MQKWEAFNKARLMFLVAYNIVWQSIAVDIGNLPQGMQIEQYIALVQNVLPNITTYLFERWSLNALIISCIPQVNARHNQNL